MANPLLKLPAPRVLLKQVMDSAPWLRRDPGPWLGEGWTTLDPKPNRPLAALAAHPLGWWSVLRAARGWQRLVSGNGGELVDYFTLALACHHASVATFVPTDVDSKIRARLWHMASTPGLVQRMASIAQHHCNWDNRPCSARILDSPDGLLSGHDGERLAVMVGALPFLYKAGLDQCAQQFTTWIDAELEREATIWQHLHRAAASNSPETRQKIACAALYLAHNAGDVDQGLRSWDSNPQLLPWRKRWQRLAKQNAEADSATKPTEPTEPMRQAFQQAAALYRCGMAAEAHRHYPLRDIACLRQEPDFLLPCPPFLRPWGARLASHPALSHAQRVEVVLGLLTAIERVPGQRAYQQALGGFVDALAQPDQILRELPPNRHQQLTRGAVAEAMAETAEQLLQHILPAKPDTAQR